MNKYSLETALINACRVGSAAQVSRLVQVAGLDLNYQDECGRSGAERASYHGHTECVQILAITGRVDWKKKDNWNGTPLYWALRWGHADIVDIIVQQPNIDYNVKTKKGETLAHAAVRGGDVKCVETLAALERCDCFNIPDLGGKTPIMIALERNRIRIVEILIRNPRVDLTCRENEGWSRLFRTIQKDMNSVTLSSMIHYIYTEELADGWQDLDIEELAKAADKYNLPGWMELFCSKLNMEEVPAEKVAEMIIVGIRYQDTVARDLGLVARNKIRWRRQIMEDWAFRERLLGELIGGDILRNNSLYL